MGTYRIDWKKSALRELKRLDKQVVPRIVEAVEGLSDKPIPPGARKLKGSDHSYRIRVGNYRIIYELLKSRLVIQIVRVRHRKEAYR